MAQEGFRSGLQPAAPGKPAVKIPQSFQAHLFNGKFADRFHSVVTENDFFPTVLIFAKDPGEGKDAPLKSLLGKLDELVEKYRPMDQYPEAANFNAYVVFLDDKAQTSLTKVDVKDAADLVKEAIERRVLYARMAEWAKPLKKVVVAVCVPEAVAKFELKPDAELTMLYYDSFNVLDNFAFADGKFTEENVAPIITKVEERLQAKIAAIEKARQTKLGKKRSRRVNDERRGLSPPDTRDRCVFPEGINPSARRDCEASLADVRQESHESGLLDGVLDRSLERGTIAGAFAAEEFALAGAHLLEALHVLVIDERGPRAAFLRAETAPVLPTTTELLANHSNPHRR